MICDFGSSIENYHLSQKPYPMLERQYWSSASDPVSVFKCSSENNCPGGQPGTCAVDMVGQACAHCKDGYQWSGSRCQRCNSVELSKILFPILPAVALPILLLCMYVFFRDTVTKWGSWQNGCAAVGFVLLNHYQILSLLSSGNIITPSPTEEWMRAWLWTVDIMSLFSVDCAGFVSMEDKMYWNVSSAVYIGSC
jgi:hypothetical protein